MSVKNILLTLCSLLVSVSAYSNNCEDSFKAKHDTIDLVKITAKAEAGDVKFQRMLGILYYKGEFVTKNIKQSFEWFQRAANAGDSASKYELSLMHRLGDIGKINKQSAAMYAEQAFSEGYKEAQFDVAVDTLMQGKDLKKAFTLFKDLRKNKTERRSFISNYYLADMYKRGEGTKQDLKKAYEIFKELGSHIPEAKYEAAMIALTSDFVKDKQKHLDELVILDENEHHEAQYQLGLIYLEGKFDIAENISKGTRWISDSAFQGNAKAQYKLAMMYRYSPEERFRVNIVQAAKIMEVLARSNPKQTKRILELHYDSQGLTQRKIRGVIVTPRINQDLVAKAQYEMGLMYLNGYGDIPKDELMASWWFREALGNGHLWSAAKIGQLLRKSPDRENKKTAKEFFGFTVIKGDGLKRDRIAEKDKSRDN